MGSRYSPPAVAPANIQEFLVSGTWTKPSGNYKTATVYTFHGGNGGGSGGNFDNAKRRSG